MVHAMWELFKLGMVMGACFCATWIIIEGFKGAVKGGLDTLGATLLPSEGEEKKNKGHGEGHKE